MDDSSRKFLDEESLDVNACFQMLPSLTYLSSSEDKEEGFGISSILNFNFCLFFSHDAKLRTSVLKPRKPLRFEFFRWIKIKVSELLANIWL